MKSNSVRNRLTAAFLTTCLIAGNIGTFPLTTYAAEEDLTIEESSEGTASKDRDIDAEITELLAAGDYEEGSAVVLYDKASPASDGEQLVGASSLLVNAESITDVSAESYVAATGDTLELPDEELVGASTDAAGDDRIGMVFVEDESRTTEELLRELLADPRVLTAEPNYIISTADVDDDAMEEAAETVIDTSFFEDASYETEVTTEDISEAADDDSEDPDTTPEDPFTTSEDPATISEDISSLSEENIAIAESDENTPETVGESIGKASGNDDVIVLPEIGDKTSNTTSHNVTRDLTPYQWGMSDGSNRIARNNVADEDVYGLCSPNWNTPGAENAEGVVAVIDTGVDYTHQDLVDSMYRFSAEEQQALGCGEYGISVVEGVRDPKDPSDYDGHGTHCAGIIAGSWDGVGISGVASGAKIMAIRALDDVGSSKYNILLNALAFVKKAKEYGIDVRVTSNSYTYYLRNYAIRVLADELGELGVVNVFASGNRDSHVDTEGNFSANIWDLPNVVIVNASDERGKAASFTNFSQNATHVFAPGVNILSTVPNTDGDSVDLAYFTELDSNPVYCDPSWNNLSDDMFAGYSKDWMTGEYWDYLSYSKVYDQSSDGTTPALKIQINKDIPIDTSFPICITLPVEKDTITENASLKFYIPPYDDYGNEINKNINASFAMFGFNSAGETVSKTQYATEGKIDWINCTISGLKSLNLVEQEDDGKYYICMYIQLMPKTGTQIKAGDYFYIDNPALSSASYKAESTSYAFMSGTSMAAPAVAGAASILYKGKSVNRESANQVTADLKASVRKNSSLAEFCTSGGAVDLSVSADQMAPVINSAVLNDAQKTITLEGYYFGSLGDNCEVTLARETLTITSWDDHSITVKCPKSMASGLQKISVTNAAGLTTIGAFSITVPESSTIEDTSVPLYEKTLTAPPSNLISNTEMITAAEPLDDYIYFTVAEEQKNEIFVEKLIRYSIENDNWEEVGEVPFGGLFYSSMESFRGCIFLSGRDKDDYNHLVRYVPSTGKWIETENGGAAGSTLINYKDELLYVGGYALSYSNTIRALDPSKDPMPTIGTLPNDFGMASVVSAGDTLYIYGGTAYNSNTDDFDTPQKDLICYTQNGNSFERDTSKEIDLQKCMALSYENLYGAICASDKEAYLVGAYMEGDGTTNQVDPDNYSVADGDTWTLGSKPENLNKRLSHTITYNPVATVYKGVLYGFGLNSLDGNPTSYIFRATTVDEDPETPIQDTVTVAIPKAVTGLVYNGKEQIGVPASTDGSYTITDNKKTEVGTYEAVLKLSDPEYYIWEDGTREDKTITWTIEDNVVHVTGVKLNKTNLVLYTGQNAQLKATVSPSDADNKKVTWKSANSKIATVDSNGKVTAKGAGTVKVTVTTADGKKKAVCTVKVIKAVPVYRLYNKKGNGEHLFTISASEKNFLMLRGWIYEGIAWYAPEKSSVPVYRFYNKNGGLHMYTSNVSEKDFIIKAGWKLEGIAFYAATTGTTKPIYRLYNPNGGQHFFTASASERNYVKKAGWKYEGAAFQMVK